MKNMRIVYNNISCFFKIYNLTVNDDRDNLNNYLWK